VSGGRSVSFLALRFCCRLRKGLYSKTFAYALQIDEGWCTLSGGREVNGNSGLHDLTTFLKEVPSRDALSGTASWEVLSFRLRGMNKVKRT
jgi:hypothetical protein